MKSIKNIVVVTVLSVISFGAFAQSISTTASTLDVAEAKISAMAEQQGFHYTITSARVGDRVHVTANLDK